MRVPRGHHPHRIADRETALLQAKLEVHTPDRRAATARVPCSTACVRSTTARVAGQPTPPPVACALDLHRGPPPVRDAPRYGPAIGRNLVCTDYLWSYTNALLGHVCDLPSGLYVRSREAPVPTPFVASIGGVMYGSTSRPGNAVALSPMPNMRGCAATTSAWMLYLCMPACERRVTDDETSRQSRQPCQALPNRSSDQIWR
jgi:hypothetical protein